MYLCIHKEGICILIISCIGPAPIPPRLPSGYISSGHRRHGRQVETGRSNLKGRFLGNWRAKKGFFHSARTSSTTEYISENSISAQNRFSGTHPTTSTVTFTFQTKVTGPIHPDHISWKCVLLAFFTSSSSRTWEVVKSQPEMCDLSKPRDHETTRKMIQPTMNPPQ